MRHSNRLRPFETGEFDGMPKSLNTSTGADTTSARRPERTVLARRDAQGSARLTMGGLLAWMTQVGKPESFRVGGHCPNWGRIPRLSSKSDQLTLQLAWV
jgi:hypothetical protein